MNEQVEELLYQMLETELGGVQVYDAALRCVQNSELQQEWEKYRDQTSRHVEIVTGLLETFGLQRDADTPGRKVVHHLGSSLVKAMQLAQSEGSPSDAELVAAECVILAEMKDHLNWELIAEVAKKLTGEKAKAVEEAVGEVEDQEAEHLYHTTGWARELWLQSLGVKAVLPPPEEQKNVTTEIGAARAKQAREKMR